MSSHVLVQGEQLKPVPARGAEGAVGGRSVSGSTVSDERGADSVISDRRRRLDSILPKCQLSKS